MRPGQAGRADARSLLRAQSQSLLIRIEAALQRTGLVAESRVHLKDVAETLKQALEAKLLRSAG